jgi:palmitoyltransferase
MQYACKVYLSFSAVFFVYIRYQGIATYDYVVEVRARRTSRGMRKEQYLIYSPSNSETTGFSFGSSLGLHHKGALVYASKNIY